MRGTSSQRKRLKNLLLSKITKSLESTEYHESSKQGGRENVKRKKEEEGDEEANYEWKCSTRCVSDRRVEQDGGR